MKDLNNMAKKNKNTQNIDEFDNDANNYFKEHARKVIDNKTEQPKIEKSSEPIIQQENISTTIETNVFHIGKYIELIQKYNKTFAIDRKDYEIAKAKFKEVFCNAAADNKIDENGLKRLKSTIEFMTEDYPDTKPEEPLDTSNPAIRELLNIERKK